MIIHIATAQIAQWRKIKEKGFELVDITVKSGNKHVAPDWDFLMDYKNSAKDSQAEQAYTEKYEAKLDKLEEENPEELLSLLKDKSCFCCYCSKGKFCHRHLLLPRLMRLAAKHKLSVIYIGELL